MSKNAFHYELSQEADIDLEEIYEYTAEKFGVEQAIKYLGNIENILDSLCSNSNLGRERPEIREGLRSISCESHTVFYRIIISRIRVIRILHGSRDTVKFLRSTASE